MAGAPRVVAGLGLSWWCGRKRWIGFVEAAVTGVIHIAFWAIVKVILDKNGLRLKIALNQMQ